GRVRATVRSIQLNALPGAGGQGCAAACCLGAATPWPMGLAAWRSVLKWWQKLQPLAIFAVLRQEKIGDRKTKFWPARG
ncbi:hypothetical protein, partial [Paenacidovorax caeni]